MTFAELYLLVACRSSTRGQGLTFTSARVLAQALFRASGYMTFGTPITSRPFGREVPLRSRAPVSSVTATVRMTAEEMCGLSLRLTYGHRVRALLVLAPPDLGALSTFCASSSQRLFLVLLQGRVSHRRRGPFLPVLSPRDTLFLPLFLCVSPPGPHFSFAWGRGNVSLREVPFLCRPPSSVSLSCCE